MLMLTMLTYDKTIDVQFSTLFAGLFFHSYNMHTLSMQLCRVVNVRTLASYSVWIIKVYKHLVDITLVFTVCNCFFQSITIKEHIQSFITFNRK